MMQPFFIASLPRARTAWLANFFSFNGCYCFHEALARCEDIKDLYRMMKATKRWTVGNSDCANALLVPEISRMFPAARWIVVIRDRKEVEQELEKIGLPFEKKWLDKIEDGIASIPVEDCIVVDYSKIDRELYRMWEFVTGMKMDPVDRDRAEQLKRFDIQINPDREREYVASNRNILKKVV